MSVNGRTPAIGTLRDRVQIQQKQMVAEDEGGHDLVYMPLATVWARVHMLSHSQRQQEDARQSQSSHSVVMRFRSDISAGDRLVYRGRNLEVIGADDLNGRKAYLSCRCRETQVMG